MPPAVYTKSPGAGSSRICRRDGQHVALTDWAFVQYLLFRLLASRAKPGAGDPKLALVNVVRSRPGEHVFVFYDPEEQIDHLALDFANSDVAGYAEAGRIMQKLINGFSHSQAQTYTASTIKELAQSSRGTLR